MGRPGEDQRTVSEEDVSVYVVDPREKESDLKELQKQYKNQDCCNQHSEEYGGGAGTVGRAVDERGVSN